MNKIWVSWSSGKDSAYALYQLLKDKRFSISGLLTTITKDFARISMHSTRKKLLEIQASRLNLPLKIIEIPKNCSNQIYEKKMLSVVLQAESDNVKYIAFGDLFLESVKQYRENQLRNSRIKPIFPLWHKNTEQLAQVFFDKGFRAIVISIDKTKVPLNLLGHEYDMNFLNQLPCDVDSCGENGEFHTFVYDAPMFNRPIDFYLGEVVEKENFIYLDILPK